MSCDFPHARGLWFNSGSCCDFFDFSHSASFWPDHVITLPHVKICQSQNLNCMSSQTLKKKTLRENIHIRFMICTLTTVSGPEPAPLATDLYGTELAGTGARVDPGTCPAST